jgi:hypothetical protein
MFEDITTVIVYSRAASSPSRRTWRYAALILSFRNANPTAERLQYRCARSDPHLNPKEIC